jgi:hypothetical protein
MKTGRFNWPIGGGFLLSVAALLSYPLVFVRWPITRDTPWANLLLFGAAAWLIWRGLRRAYAPGRRRWLRAAVSSLLAVLSAGLLASFVWGVFIVPRRLPASSGAPAVGQKAPDFTLADANNTPVSLQELLASSRTERAASSGVLLIFYRGFW